MQRLRDFDSWTLLFVVASCLSAGCLQPVCEAPGSCPSFEATQHAGPTSGVDAGPDAGIDAGPGGGTDAGLDGGCTDNSQCPSGTECDFTCEHASANQPYNSYGPTGVCNPNPKHCTHDHPQSCADFVSGSYCDFEGRCVPDFACQKNDMSCPQGCAPVDVCGCRCPKCVPTAAAGH
jgi:hypothetical protein